MTVAPDDTTPSTPAGAGASVVDLDKARAIRREGRGDNLEVVNKGQRFLLPVELPVDAVAPLAGLANLTGGDDDENVDQGELETIRQALEGGLAALFCDEGEPPLDDDDQVATSAKAHAEACAWRRFLATRPSMDDELELWAGLFAAYGTSLGEALASLDSSPSGGRPANPTPGDSAEASSSQPPAGDRATRKATGKASSSRARKRATAKAGGGTKRAAGTRASRS